MKFFDKLRRIVLYKNCYTNAVNAKGNEKAQLYIDRFLKRKMDIGEELDGYRDQSTL